MSFLRDNWVVAAWSHELPAGELLARRLLGEPLVMDKALLRYGAVFAQTLAAQASGAERQPQDTSTAAAAPTAKVISTHPTAP